MVIFDSFKSRNKGHIENSIPSQNKEEKFYSGVCNRPLDAKYTPERILTLGPRDVFVFGSNLAGHHAGGTARIAFNRFGAVWGQGEGLQGNSYAIPTMQGGVETIKPYVDKFIEFAENEKALTFYVTKIGCGIAGFEIKDIAPLFRNAYYLPNVILPIEFVDYIERENRSIHSQNSESSTDNAIPGEVTTHWFGITRTFADIIIELNKTKQYSSPEQIIADLDEYLKQFKSINLSSLAVKTLRYILVKTPELFAYGYLNVHKLRDLIFSQEYFIPRYHKAYDSYCREKLINLVSYLNEFRRYGSSEEVFNDLVNNTSAFCRTACVSTPEFYYLDLGNKINYPVEFFIEALNSNWSEITTNGILNSHKMIQFMFGNHDDSVKQFGLEATIQRDYIKDSPCHPEVLVPKVMGTAPIYVKEAATGRYMRSCGEGKGPNSIPDWLEFQIAKKILEKDKSYKHIGNYYIPIYDNTLPVYGEYSGRIVFNTQAEKLRFIEDVKLGKNVWR